MKESTKNRLKKFGKVTAYGLGLFAMFLLGVGLGNCSVKDKPVKANAVTEFSLTEKKALTRKRALDPDVWRTLSTNGDNLLLDADAGHYTLVRYQNGPAIDGWRIEARAGYDMYLVKLGAGRFVLDVGSSGDSWFGAYNFLSDAGASEVIQCFGGDSNVFIDIGDSVSASGFDLAYAVSNPRRLFDVSDSYPWGLFIVSNAVSLNVSISVYDPLTMSPMASIDMGEYYNPLPMIGQTINDASIIVYPSAGSEVNVAPVDFVTSSGNPLLFVSSGQVFDGFRIELSRVMNVDGGDFERYATKSGETIKAPLMSFNYVTANAFYYRLVSTQQWVKVWELPYNGTDQGYNYWSYNGRWLSNSFRFVAVKVDGGGSGLSSWLPTFTFTDLLSLNVWRAGSYVLGDAYNNVFTMLGKGFESVGGILSIQILPYMTLGTLIFVPLVVLIIFAILRILNK